MTIIIKLFFILYTFENDHNLLKNNNIKKILRKPLGNILAIQFCER